MADDRRYVRFGPFEVDLVAGELRREGRLVALQQQPFRLLRALLEHPGEPATREVLRRTLWPQGTFVSFERGLTSAMRKVREALGDRADVPVYIETLPQRGYRFIAAASFSAVSFTEVSFAAAHINAPAVSRRAPMRRLGWAAAVLIAVPMASTRIQSPVAANERMEAALSLSAYACVLRSEGRYEDALTVIQQAHELVPESARIMAEMGMYLNNAEYFDSEMPTLRKAVALDARSVDAWLHLGLGYARRSNYSDAILALERARALAPDDARVQQWIDWARARA